MDEFPLETDPNPVFTLEDWLIWLRPGVQRNSVVRKLEILQIAWAGHAGVNQCGDAQQQGQPMQSESNHRSMSAENSDLPFSAAELRKNADPACTDTIVEANQQLILASLHAQQLTQGRRPRAG